MDVDSERTRSELKIHAEIKKFEEKTGKTVTKVSLCGDPDTVVLWLEDKIPKNTKDEIDYSCYYGRNEHVMK